MRRLLALGAVAAVVGPPASAHARKPAVRELDVFDRELDVLDGRPIEPCPRGKTWAVVQRCLDKHYRAQHANVELVLDAGTLKVVSAGVTADARQLIVYSQLPTEWLRAGVTIRASKLEQVLRVETFPTPLGDAVRIDVGTSSRSGFSLAPGAIVRGIVRRRTSHVCLPGGVTCRSLVTTCEAYAHGKAYFVFHGELVWHPTLGLRMRGNPTLGGSVCRPSTSLLVGDDDG